MIGSLPDIGKVGARLFAYRTVPETNDHAKYFDLLMENIGRDAIPIKDVEITPKIVKKVWETMLDFYRITKGSHGDLHGENMYLTSTGEVKIIDYGMYRPFINPKDSLFLRNYMNKKVVENSNIAYEPEKQKIPDHLLNALLQYNNNHRSKIRNWWHTIQKNA
jgi:RIO-like serine/threonine protein kinase